MNPNERTPDTSTSPTATPGASTAGTPQQPGASGEQSTSQRSSLGQMASGARDAIAHEAATLTDEAARTAAEQAERAKGAATSHLEGFAGALRAASDELSRNKTGPAAELVSHAASGLETLSRSIDGKSSGEMLDAVRRFGRENPLGFVAGSILAGFALGRVASTATSGSSRSSSAHDTSSASRNFADRTQEDPS